MEKELLEKACSANLYSREKNIPDVVTLRSQFTIQSAMVAAGLLKSEFELWITNSENWEKNSYRIESFEEAKQLAHRLNKRGLHGYVGSYIKRQDDYGWFTIHTKIIWVF